MIVSCKNREVFEGPKQVNTENVQYWCRHTKELKNSQVSKAYKFLKYESIKYVGKAFENLGAFEALKDKYPDAKHIFICLPLNTKYEHEFLGVTIYKTPYEKDYNNSEYIIFKRSDGTFECNCQGWQSKAKNGEIIPEGANCSHVLALYYNFKLKKFGVSEGAEDYHLKPDMIGDNGEV